MISPRDVARWMEEAGPALRGAFVHRVWREEETFVLLLRRHEGDDPTARAVSRVALELDVEPATARAVALPPDDVAADDDRAKKAQARDSNAFLALLRRTLVGARVEAVAALPGERIATLDLVRPQSGAAAEVEVEKHREPPPPRSRLVVELFGRRGNLIVCARDGDRVVCLGALQPGKGARTFERGAAYAPPPPRQQAADEAPSLCADVAPDPATLALGRAVAAVQREKAEAAAAASRLVQLRRAARTALQRAASTKEKLEQQVRDAQEADAIERRADLLKAALHSIPRGAKEVQLTDQDGTTFTLPLDPTEPAADQMAALYKKAKKLRSGEAAVQQRLGELDGQEEALRGLEARLEAADPDDEAALDGLEAELRKRGALPKEQPAGKPRQQQVNQGPRSFRTKEGHEVLVGRNDEENDHLTMRVARGNDLFFHVAGCPGSHTILRVDPKRPPNHESLLDAACVAVHYSKARNRGAVEVHYVPRKWVKKPRGAKAGLVQISNFKSIRAGGDPERIQRVLATAASRGDAAEEAS